MNLLRQFFFSVKCRVGLDPLYSPGSHDPLLLSLPGLGLQACVPFSITLRYKDPRVSNCLLISVSWSTLNPWLCSGLQPSVASDLQLHLPSFLHLQSEFPLGTATYSLSFLTTLPSSPLNTDSCLKV